MRQAAYLILCMILATPVVLADGLAPNDENGSGYCIAIDPSQTPPVGIDLSRCNIPPETGFQLLPSTPPAPVQI